VLANSANPLNRVNLGTARQAAEKLAVKIEVVEVSSAADVEGALARIMDLRPDAALLASDTLLLSKRKEIANFMAQQRIPAIYPFKEYTDVGGLFIYGANISVPFERAADYLNKVLKGEKVSNLPVQQATAFELIVNSRTASALGLTVPPSILFRADEVIE
jgi:putative ABC transport system substrate-binding protein